MSEFAAPGGFMPAVEAIAREAAEEIGVELVSVRFHRDTVRGRGRKKEAGRPKGSGGGAGAAAWSEEESVLSVRIHREGGTAIRDCEEVSRRMECRLDEGNVILGGYVLEVESRGIELPPLPGVKAPRHRQQRGGWKS